MKGGYQIVEIGTGISGIYKKLEAAYNSGKPILVKKGGKVSFGNVTKDGNYYVANYIIDDTLYQDTISALDAITDSSIDIGGSAGDIADIEERLDANNFGTVVMLESYTTDANLYTFPSDGYILISAQPTDTIVGGYLYGSNGDLSKPCYHCIRPVSTFAGAVYNSVYVKKGMKWRSTWVGGEQSYIKFLPLV